MFDFTEVDEALTEGNIGKALGVAGGMFSVCWSNPAGAGEFQSTEAAKVVDHLVEGIKEYVRKEVVKGRSFGPIVDAHSVKSGLFDPEAQQRDTER